jgi:hypothetical protein
VCVSVSECVWRDDVCMYVRVPMCMCVCVCVYVCVHVP